VAPVLLPDVPATRHDGVRVRLRDVFAGRRTAVQFIFMDCTTACPLLGSLFGKVDKALGGTEAQLVSITVNPERDTPQRLAAWLQRFQGGARWVGLRLEAAELAAVQRAFQQETGPPTGHTLQVFLVDGGGRYVARTVAMPGAAAIAEELRVGMAAERDAEAGGPGGQTGADVFAGRGTVTGRIGNDRLEAHARRCSGCHGQGQEGGGEGRTVVPPLTASALTGVHARRGGPPSRYDEKSFCAGLRTGIDPAGVQYSNLMPRYEMDGRTCHQLWTFLTGSR
jgi:cytochrome oxidase Cu insertion factor (SCO1/SenC/PrrC family)